MKKKDLGMTFEQAVDSGLLGNCYQILGKFYTSETATTAPEVKLGQCPVCGTMSWQEEEGRDFGRCSNCDFCG